MDVASYEFMVDVVVFTSRQYGEMRAYDDSRREVGSLLSLWAYASHYAAYMLKRRYVEIYSKEYLIDAVYTYVHDTHAAEMREFSEDPETWEFDKYDLADLASLKQDLESLIKEWSERACFG